MRSVEQQLALVMDAAVKPEPVRTAIAHALGLMCAEEVQANQPLPGFPQAVIDGYAVRAVDVGGEKAIGAQPEQEGVEVERSLPVVGEVPAGSRQPLRLQPRQAVRVYTGAPLPTLAARKSTEGTRLDGKNRPSEKPFGGTTIWLSSLVC